MWYKNTDRFETKKMSSGKLRTARLEHDRVKIPSLLYNMHDDTQDDYNVTEKKKT